MIICFRSCAGSLSNIAGISEVYCVLFVNPFLSFLGGRCLTPVQNNTVFLWISVQLILLSLPPTPLQITSK